MKSILSFALAVTAAAYSPAASAAEIITDINPGDPVPTGFTLLSGNPFGGTEPLIANLSRFVSSANEYVDRYIFTIGPVVDPVGSAIGVGDGSVTYSFSGSPGSTFTSLVFDNGFGVFSAPIENTTSSIRGSLGNVPVFSGVQNVLTVRWTALQANQNYTGTLNFTPVPEPMTWALMIFGFAAVGFSMRRRKNEVARVRFAF